MLLFTKLHYEYVNVYVRMTSCVSESQKFISLSTTKLLREVLKVARAGSAAGGWLRKINFKCPAYVRFLLTFYYVLFSLGTHFISGLIAKFSRKLIFKVLIVELVKFIPCPRYANGMWSECQFTPLNLILNMNLHILNL